MNGAGRTARIEGGRRMGGILKAADSAHPLVTVVTVIYNDANDVEAVIKNIRSQTYPQIEYIVIDGGSTDDTLDILRRHNDEIDYWISEPDRGIYDAMNKGVNLARGQWINFMNAGDAFYNTETISTVMNTAPADADLVYGHTYYRDGDTLTLIETYDISTLWMSMIFSHQSLFVRTELLRKHPFNLRYAITSDYEFIYHCYVNNRKFHDTRQIVAVHSVDGVSEERIIKRMMERWAIVRSYTPSWKVNGFYLKLLFKKLKRVAGRRS